MTSTPKHELFFFLPCIFFFPFPFGTDCHVVWCVLWIEMIVKCELYFYPFSNTFIWLQVRFWEAIKRKWFYFQSNGLVTLHGNGTRTSTRTKWKVQYTVEMFTLVWDRDQDLLFPIVIVPYRYRSHFRAVWLCHKTQRFSFTSRSTDLNVAFNNVFPSCQRSCV